MKKSIILKVLGESVKNYCVLQDNEEGLQFLHVQVNSMNWLHLLCQKMVDDILHIMPVDNKTIEIVFNSEVVID